jgi:hypothetical protein
LELVEISFHFCIWSSFSAPTKTHVGHDFYPYGFWQLHWFRHLSAAETRSQLSHKASQMPPQ